MQKYKKEVSEPYFNTVRHRVETYLLPKLSKKDVKKIVRRDLIELLQAIQDAEKIELARRIRNYLYQIFRLAQFNELISANPADGIEDALAKRPRVQHRAKLKEHELAEFFERLGAAKALPITKLAILFTILTAARTVETRLATKDQIINLDGPSPLWLVPAEIMKMKREHLQPLSAQAVTVLKQAYSLYPDSKIIFPSAGRQRSTSGYMSTNAMLYCLYSMNYFGKSTVHGFRGTFSTVLNENGFNRDWVEFSLAHVEEDDVRAAYNSATYLKQRIDMMKWLADYLVQQGC